MGQIVGWVNADLRPRLRRYDEWGMPLVPDTSIVACFVVHPTLRCQGIASQLLEVALEHLGSLGAKRVEAFGATDPVRDAEDEQSYEQSAHHGPLPMYQAAGFALGESRDNVTRVLKMLDEG